VPIREVSRARSDDLDSQNNSADKESCCKAEQNLEMALIGEEEVELKDKGE
jgi:hypothetical protein